MTTVHLDGSGQLVSMDLDDRQASGQVCARCGNDTVADELVRTGTVVGTTEVKVHKSCRHQGS